MKDLISKYLIQVNIMQLATSTDGKPWVCNLHYISDDKFNLYWFSTPDRRHSKEIQKNPNASAAILVHEDSKDEDYVIGISLEGKAEKLDWHDYEDIIPGFASKHETPKTFLDSIVMGKNPHIIYVLRPSKIVLFDNKNFPEEPRQEWKT